MEQFIFCAMMSLIRDRNSLKLNLEKNTFKQTDVAQKMIIFLKAIYLKVIDLFAFKI